MSDAPLAPDCRHCGATNSSWASECWLCHRKDWRTPPKKPSGRSPSGPGDRSKSKGRMAALRTAGLTILILFAAIGAVAIALFGLCMRF